MQSQNPNRGSFVEGPHTLYLGLGVEGLGFRVPINDNQTDASKHTVTESVFIPITLLF